MVLAANLGYPRIGAQRELKRALESYWAGKSDEASLLETGRQLRLRHWQQQREAGIDVIPSNDFSFYDGVLDTSLMLGALPARYGWREGAVSLDTYFALARGAQHDDVDIAALEMTKWFDTNYHYIVPELAPGQALQLSSTKAVGEFNEAQAAGIHTRPVLLGPLSYLLLSKTTDGSSALDLLPEVLPVYREVLEQLAAAGADWVQIDEPWLVRDLADAARAAYNGAYARLAEAGIKLMLTTYFGGLEDNLELAVGLPVAGLHIDLARAPGQLDAVLAQLPTDKTLSLGLVDGRNVWRTDLDTRLAQLQTAVAALGTERVQMAPSCSLLFSPHDLTLETGLDAELYSWLAFAHQKLAEVVQLKRAANEGEAAVADAFAASRAALASRRASPRTADPSVRARLAAVGEDQLQRASPYERRRAQQAARLALPPLPTTTIGSFPQTGAVRTQRAAYNRGALTEEQYAAFLRGEIEKTVRQQEEIGLDVLVHGEFERTDMVEYFGERLTGIAFTQHGWVQSYGSRGVRPPILFGDVARPQPMTVAWSAYAQSLTQKPLKGMLTGPVTILEWSFVRDDQPRAETCRQLALALRDEVADLEAAGIAIIQIDEPALREGLPLRHAAQADYLRWAIDCFRLASSGVRDETQIHTHMCYAEFGEIIAAIARMDADVISIEASRSKMELLITFRHFDYPNGIGPGMYDIHSPRVPSQEEIAALIAAAVDVMRPEQLWINPDCGLKTRHWEEVIPALQHMVGAARVARAQLTAGVGQGLAPPRALMRS